MPRKEVVPGAKNYIALFPPFNPMKIKYKDVFDIKAFYETLHEWLLENGWQDEIELLGNADRYETYYAERVGQSGAKEIWVSWRTHKKPTDANFLTYYLDFDWHCIGISNTEIIKEGRKMSVQKGELNLEIKAFIELKYLEKFEENWFLKMFQDLFHKRLYHKITQQRRKELYQETYELQNFIKQWFKLKRYLPYEESKGFFTSQAWPSHLKD